MVNLTLEEQQIFHAALQRSVKHIHNWIESNKINIHVGGEPVVYVTCKDCGQIGFRKPPSRVVYTWKKNDKE